MAIKELALIKEARNRKKKKETTPAIIKPIKEVVKNKKGTTKINRAKVSEKPNAQNTIQNRVLTNKERLTSKPTTSNINKDIRTIRATKNANKDIRTVKTNNKRYSTKIVDIYERDGQYYYKDGKKEKTLDTNFVKNAIKNNRNGVIGAYDSKGKLRETDERGNIKTAKSIRKEKVQNLKNQLDTWKDNIKSGNISVSQAITDAANTFDAATDFGPGKFYKNAAKNRINALDRLWTGSTRALEGVMDTANDLTSAITQRQNYAINRLRGMSEKDAKKVMEEEQKENADWVKRDLVNDFKDKTGYNKIQPSLEEGSIVKKDNMIGKTLEGVGGMLPALAVGQVANLGLATKSTEGLSGLAKAKTVIGNLGRGFANQVGANTALAGQSFGSGLEEAYANGATGKQARMFGLLNTVTELGTEWISSGIPGTKSEGVLDDIVESLIDRKTAKITNKYVSNVINAVVKSQAKGIGEGIEEALAEIINPYIKNLTYSDGEKVDWKDVKDSALTGYFVGMFLNSPESIDDLKKGINDAKIETARKEQLLSEIDQMVKEAKVYTPEQREQANEIAERVASGQIKENEGLALLEQIKDGTYQQNRNLEQIATQERENLVQAAQQGQITPQQYTQGLQTLANTVNQTREEINTPQQDPYEEIRNELRNENENTSEQNYEGLNQKEYNEIQRRYKDLIETTGFEEDFVENAKPSDILGQLKSIKELYEGDEGFLYVAKNWEGPEVYKDTKSQYDKINRLINRFEGKINKQQNVETNQNENRINDHTLEYNGYYIMSEKPNVGYEYKSLEESPRFQIYDANNDDITHNVANWVNSIDEAKQYIDNIKKLDNNTKTTKNENIPATKSENVISEETKSQKQKPTNTNKKIDKRLEKYKNNNLTKEQQNQILKIKDQLEKDINLMKDTSENIYSSEEKGRKIKGYSLQAAGEIREVVQGDSLDLIDNGLTPKELQKKLDRENSNYNGKEVIVDGKKGKILSRAYGKFKIELEDGNVVTKTKEEFEPAKKIPRFVSEVNDYRTIKQEGETTEENEKRYYQTNHLQNENTQVYQKTKPQKRIQKEINTQIRKLDQKSPEILDKMPTEKKSIFNKLKEKYNAFRHHFTDHREAWYDLSRETRNPDINSRADAIDLANGKAQVDIGRAQIDYNGKRYKNFTDENGNKVSMSFEGAYDLYNKIPVKAKNEFLVHNLNIDRLNQGVDQFDIPLQESQAKLAELRQTYPDIDKWSENIYQYYRNHAQKLVDGGRLPQSKVNEWQTTTPHYVHIQRDMGQNGNSGVDTKNGRVDSDRLIQKVKGGNYPILPIKQTSADFTRNSIEALQINNLGKEYLKTVGVGSRADGTQQINDMDDIFGINQDLIKDDGKGNYTFVVYDKGNVIEVPISKDMYEGLKPRDIRNLPTSKVIKFQREIITNKNPVFGFVRNPGKDLQAMLLYSKHPAYKSLSTYNKLFTERTVTKNKPFSKEEGTMPQEIVELFYDQGNQANSFYNNGEFESEKSKNIIASGVEKALSPVEKGANFMESMPRITEFWNTVQAEGYTVRNGEVISRKEAITQQAEEDLKNNKITQKEYNKRLKKAQKMKNPTKSVEQVLMEASHDAAEITVNFKRGGTWGKNLDKNFAVYSSPAIQGAAKFGRTITEAVGDAKAGDWKAARRLVTRAAALGIAPALLSEAMYGDDDDYKDIQDYQKDQYYLIKGPEGKWIRIPKGREISTMQSFTRRSMDKAKGEKDAFKGYGSFAINQVGPTNPLESNFLSPVISAFLTNRSWSGNPIVSDYMKNNFADEDQYNEKTDELSKWIGKKTGISPMKINYILDQYSGGLGDVALPYITPKASNDAKGPISSILKNELTFDQANSSKSVSKFYDAKNEINKAFKKRNASDEDKVKKVYMGTISQSLFDLSTKKREIQMDKNLSKKEKYEQALDVQKKMNKLTSDAVKNLDNVDVGENTATIGGILLYKNKNSKNGWSQESEKATKNREKLGLSPEKYYYYKNEESYTPPGKEYSQSITSGKNAKYNIAIVDAFNFDPSDYLEYKYKLSKIRGNKDSRGRTIRYSARNKKLKYLNTLPISAVEKAYLMKQNDKYYKGSDYNLKKAISNSSLSNKEKKELYSYLKLGR